VSTFQDRFTETSVFRRFDWNFASMIFFLNVIGLINLYSATHGAADLATDRLFVQQILWLTLGWVVYFIVTMIDYQIFIRLAWVIYGLNLLALIAVIFFGKVALGAQRWLDLGFFSYQPSETMKLALVLILARTMSDRTFPSGMGLRQLAFPLFVLIGTPFLITAEQPDLGTAMMLLIIGGTVLLFIGIRLKILAVVAALGVSAGVGAWFFLLHDYQRNRVEVFLNPGSDPKGKGYNSIQSKIAVGSGQVLGKGFRKGTQSQLEFLPERHTDFIFSVLSEEHGFTGSLITMGFFAWLFVLGVSIAQQARDRAGSLLAFGIMGILFWHFFINIAMVIGLLPIVGIPLPLLSYGGSNMLTTMAALGIVSSISYRKYLF
jgi:rod shape determining protein RodA